MNGNTGNGMSVCPHCGSSTASAQDVIDGLATYADTQGGHNDRHTLVVEAAEHAVHNPATGPNTRPPEAPE